MKYLWVTAIVLCTAFSAHADSAKSKFRVSTSGGINTGIDTDMDPGYAFTVAPGIKFIPEIGASLDLGFGSMDQGRSQFTNVFLMVHAYWQMPYVNISFGVGAGYSQIKTTYDDPEIPTSTRTPAYVFIPPLKATLTALYPVVAGLELGLGVDFIFNGPMSNSLYYENNDSLAVSQLQVGLAAAYTF